MHFIKKTLITSSILSLFGIVLLQSSASAQVLDSNRELSFGDRGTEVSLLQDFLKEEGFFNVEATGYFGPITQEAVIRYQIENDIEVTDGSFALEVKSVQDSQFSVSTTVTNTSSEGFSVNTFGGKVRISIDKTKLLDESYDGVEYKKIKSISVYRKNSTTEEMEQIGKTFNKNRLNALLDPRSNGLSVSKKKNLVNGYDQVVIVAELSNASSTTEVSFVVYSDSPETTDALTFKIKKVKGVRGSYKPGQVIAFTVAGIKSDGKTLPVPADGYHVQAHISDANQNGLDGVNAEYNYDKNVWEVEMVAPTTRGKYIVSASLYCSDRTKICYTYFGGPTEDIQVTWDKKISVKGKAVATSSVEEVDDTEESDTTDDTESNSDVDSVVPNTISDATHKCFARTDIRSPWIFVKCESKAYKNALEINKMAIARKNTDE